MAKKQKKVNLLAFSMQHPDLDLMTPDERAEALLKFAKQKPKARKKAAGFVKMREYLRKRRGR